MFTPVLKIGKHWQAPQREGFQLDLTGEQFLKQAQIPPGQMTNLRLSPLSKETQYIEDPLAGQIPFRFREIAPDYAFRWIDTANSGPMAWLQPPMPDELAQRAAARAIIQVKVDELLAKAQKTIAEVRTAVSQAQGMASAAAQAFLNAELSRLSVAERGQLLGALVQLTILDGQGTGFLETVPNFHDCGATGVRWNFALPNIDKILLSSWKLQQDQKQCFRLFRMPPLPDQVRHTFEILLGNGSTQYALVLIKDEAVEFRHYRNMNPNQRAQLEAELKAVLETGYLTAEDLAFIAERQARIDELKKQTGATGNTQPGSAARTEIAGLKAEIKARKASKNGLTDAMEAERARLERLLFYKKVPVTLQEDTRSLYNQIVNITLGFHRKGYVSIRIGLGAEPGKEPFYYEVEGITKTKRPGTILPRGCHIMLRSNGGPFGLAWGVGDAQPLATLYSQPFPIPFLFDPDDWRFAIDGIGLDPALADPNEPLQLLPRCRVVARMEEVTPGQVYEGSEGPDGNPVIRVFPTVRACLDFISEAHPAPASALVFDPYVGNRDYGAEIYRATVVCVAGQPPDFATIQWDSTQQGFPIEDMQLESSLDRGATHTIFLRDNARRPANLPENLENRWAEVGVIDTRAGANYGQYIPLARGGVVREPSAENLRRLFARAAGGNITLEPARRLDSERHLIVAGLESKLDKPITVPLIGNNMWPGDYLYELFAIHGIPDELLTGIPVGAQPGLFQLPPPRPGDYPDIRPTRGDSLWSFALEVVAKHCLGWRLRCDALAGVVLERAIFRDRTAVNYSTGAAHDDFYSVQREPKGGGGQTSLRIWQDTKDYWPEAYFFGAWNPGAGRRYASSYRIWQATNQPGSLYYIGDRKIYWAKPDDSLSSQVRCDLATRQFNLKFGLPPWYAAWLTWYDPDRREGDLIRLDGIKVVTQRLGYPRFQKGLEQKMRIEVRLAEDSLTLP